MRSVWLCLGFALFLAAHPAEALTKRVRNAKPESAAKQAPPVDTRPRYRRDDTPAPVVAAPAAQPVVKKKRSARHKPAATPAGTAAAPAATEAVTAPKGAKATPRDIVA